MNAGDMCDLRSHPFRNILSRRAIEEVQEWVDNIGEDLFDIGEGKCMVYETATQRIVNVKIGEAISGWLAGGERDPFEEVPQIIAEHPQYMCWRGKQISRFIDL